MSNRSFGLALLVASTVAAGGFARADEAGAKAILEKGIQSLGGEEKLSKAKAHSWKAKGTITFNGIDNDFTSEGTIQGLDQLRSEFEGDFSGNTVKGVTVVNGKQAWRKFNDSVMELDDDAVTGERRSIALIVIPSTLLPLKGKDFKVDLIGEEKVDNKPAAVLKVTGPDGKDFKLYLDKETGLPVKQVADIIDFTGQERSQEWTFRDYKDLGGLKRATRVEISHDGEPFLAEEITEVKLMEKVSPETFAEPE
jgi:hypothetical protein